jgi:hypothetical protein
MENSKRDFEDESIPKGFKRATTSWNDTRIARENNGKLQQLLRNEENKYQFLQLEKSLNLSSQQICAILETHKDALKFLSLEVKLNKNARSIFSIISKMENLENLKISFFQKEIEPMEDYKNILISIAKSNLSSLDIETNDNWVQKSLICSNKSIKHLMLRSIANEKENIDWKILSTFQGIQELDLSQYKAVWSTSELRNLFSKIKKSLKSLKALSLTASVDKFGEPIQEDFEFPSDILLSLTTLILSNFGNTSLIEFLKSTTTITTLTKKDVKIDSNKVINEIHRIIQDTNVTSLKLIETKSAYNDLHSSRRGKLGQAADEIKKLLNKTILFNEIQRARKIIHFEIINNYEFPQDILLLTITENKNSDSALECTSVTDNASTTTQVYDSTDEN